MAVGRRFDSPLENTGNSTGNPPRLEDAALDVFGNLAEMRIAGSQLGPRIADPDDRLALKFVVGNTLVLHPAAIHEAILIGAAEPLGRSQRTLF